MLTVVAAPDTDSNIWLLFSLYNGYQLVIAGHVKINTTDNYASFNSNIQSYLSSTAVPGATAPLQYKCEAIVCQWTGFSLVSQQKNGFFLVIVCLPQFACHHIPMLAPGYINWVQEWQRRMSNINNVFVNASSNGIQIQREQQRQRSPKVITQSGLCDECSTAGADEFHHCKLDAIVVGNKPNFGPIEPKKQQTGSYSLFRPMPGVDSILHTLKQSVADK